MKDIENNQQCKNSPEHLQPELTRLKKRTEFQAVAKGISRSRKAFKIQTIKRKTERSIQINPSSIRIGFTVTKKTGNSPERNRIKRRLREAWQIVAPTCAKAGYDYVLIGRRHALLIKFEELKSDLENAIRQVGKQYDELLLESENHSPTPLEPKYQ